MAPPGWNVSGPPKRSKAEGAEMWGTQSGRHTPQLPSGEARLLERWGHAPGEAG